MRVKRIEIEQWRIFRRFEWDNIPLDAPMVCLVAENGGGKSSLLELLVAAAYQVDHSGGGFGFSRTVQFSPEDRGKIVFDIASDIGLRDAISEITENDHIALTDWDATIEIGFHFSQFRTPALGGVDNEVAAAVFEKLHNRRHRMLMGPEPAPFPGACVLVGSDRQFPPLFRANQPHDALPVLDIGTVVARFIDDSERQFQERVREWRSNLEDYAGKGVAPEHPVRDELRIPGIDGLLPDLHSPVVTDRIETSGTIRDVAFVSNGSPVFLGQMSSGQRDIVFFLLYLIHFGDELQGLLLIDEPELHLHPELARRKLRYLRDHAGKKQIWIATHSYEAVEIAGESNTFVLSRDSTGIVNGVERWGANRAAASIATSLGYPAFSFARTPVVYVEGNGGPDTRSLFELVINRPDVVVAGGGNCTEVERRIEYLSAFAGTASDPLRQLRVRGIVDRDFLSDAEVAALRAKGVFALTCRHEENMYLDPAAIALFPKRHKMTGSYEEALRGYAKQWAWEWIDKFSKHEESVSAKLNPKAAFRPDTAALEQANWATIEADPAWVAKVVVRYGELSEDQQAEVDRIFRFAVEAFANMVSGADIWRWCLGKRVLGEVAGKWLGFGEDGVSTLRGHVLQRWLNGEAKLPEPALRIRDEVASWLSSPGG